MTDQNVSRRQFVKGSAAAAAGATAGIVAASNPSQASAAPVPDEVKRTRSYNENMEYRRLGKTGLWLSAISIGGHWKKIKYGYGSEDFKKNRREVLAACIDHGINYIDACWNQEVDAYGEAIRGRRDEIFFGFSCGANETRFPEWANSLEKMKEGYLDGLKRGGLDHADLWRITMHEQTSHRNSEPEIEIAMQALAWAKKEGLARFTGVSSHDRPWIAQAVEKYPQLEVIVTPYTADTKEKPTGSMFESLRKNDVGMIGIKPFASGSVFQSRGEPDSTTKEEDDERARLVLRYVLCNDVLTAAIPGLVTIDQVKNAAAAVRERRELDLADTVRLEQIRGEMWANMPAGYKWLKDWEWV